MRLAFVALIVSLAACGCTTTQAPVADIKPKSDVKTVSPAATETPQPVVIPATLKKELPKPVYKPLVYGEQKPLVCKEPFLATGPMKNRPNLQVMWEHYLYPRPEGIWSEIGGLVERNGNLPFDQGRWTNACTVRLSHMLNKAGFKVPQMDAKTVSGGNKDQYIFRLADMEAYLIEAYGDPDVAILDGTGNSFDLPAKPGIVLTDLPDNSFTGHITIWNGAGTVDASEVGGYRVLFWELPCFIPPERDGKTLQASNEIN